MFISVVEGRDVAIMGLLGIVRAADGGGVVSTTTSTISAALSTWSRAIKILLSLLQLHTSICSINKIPAPDSNLDRRPPPPPLGHGRSRVSTRGQYPGHEFGLAGFPSQDDREVVV